MKTRILQSLKVILLILVVIFLPYYIGLGIIEKPVKEHEEVIIWLGGFFSLIGSFVILLATFLWLRWVITGKKPSTLFN